jgi:hypothetical protein
MQVAALEKKVGEREKELRLLRDEVLALKVLSLEFIMLTYLLYLCSTIRMLTYAYVSTYAQLYVCDEVLALKVRSSTYADVCTRMLTHAHVCSRMLRDEGARAYICMYMHVYTHTHTHTYIHIYNIYIIIFIYIYTPHTHTHTHTHTNTNTHTHTHTHTHIHTYIHIYVYIYSDAMLALKYACACIR